MCKRNFRKNLYDCALLYKNGLISDATIKKCFSEYTIKIIEKDLYKQIDKYLTQYEEEFNYARWRKQY